LNVRFRVAQQVPDLLAEAESNVREALMRLSFRGVIALVFMAFMSGVQAQDGTPGSTTNAISQTQRPALTRKERLGPKWTDEQRIDNCHVPIDKRGSRPRSSACPNSPSS
jgi:hypothetical protein